MATVPASTTSLVWPRSFSKAKRRSTGTPNTFTIPQPYETGAPLRFHRPRGREILKRAMVTGVMTFMGDDRYGPINRDHGECSIS